MKKRILGANIIILIFTIVLYIYGMSNNMYIRLRYLEAFLLIQFCFSIFSLWITNKNFFTIPAVLLYTLFVFNLGRVFLALFGLGSYNKLTWFMNNYLDYRTLFILLFCLILTVQGITVGGLFFSDTEHKINISFNETLYKYSKIVFIAALIPYSIRTIILIRINMLYGYAYFYSNGVYLNPILSISDEVLKYSFYMLLASNPKWKTAIKYIVIYSLMNVISIFIGFRGAPMAELLVVIVYIFYKNRNSISVTKIGAGFLALVILASVVGEVRTGFGKKKSADRPNVLVSFLTDQGYALNVLSLVVKNKEKYFTNDSDYLTYPIKYGLLAHFNRKESMGLDNRMLPVERKSLAHFVSYIANDQIYMEGSGMGGSHIGELYSAGGITGVLVGNVLISVILMGLLIYSLKNRYVFYLLFSLLGDFFIMHRNYTLGFLMQLPRVVIFLLGFIALIYIGPKIESSLRKRINKTA